MAGNSGIAVVAAALVDPESGALAFSGKGNPGMAGHSGIAAVSAALNLEAGSGCGKPAWAASSDTLFLEREAAGFVL